MRSEVGAGALQAPPPLPSVNGTGQEQTTKTSHPRTGGLVEHDAKEGHDAIDVMGHLPSTRIRRHFRGCRLKELTVRRPDFVQIGPVFGLVGQDFGLIDGAQNVNSHRWAPNGDGTITVSFNCGDDAPNNIDTQGEDFSFTMRYYGVSQKVVDGEIAPEKTVQ